MRGKRSHEIGREHEKLAVSCFNAPWVETPEWLIELRLATPEEDGRGIDIVAVTDVGDIGIQVKSSRRFLKRHEERYGKVPVVIVRLGDTEKRVRGRVLRIIEAERAKLLVESGHEEATPEVV